MERFQDRRIIVTGGGSGIGRATVLRLLSEAGTVHTVDVDEPGLVGTAELADAEGIGKRLTTGVLDISDERAVDEGVRATVERLGGLDVLVNAAGILARREHARVHARHVEPGDQRSTSPARSSCAAAAIPALLESDHAAIVNFSSTSATFGHPYMAAYAASKGGIDAMTHTLAMEYAKRGIRVTAVAPGSIQSGITETTGGMLPAETDWGLFAKMSPDPRRRLRAAGGGGVGHRHARVRRRCVRHRHVRAHRRRYPRLSAATRRGPSPDVAYGRQLTRPRGGWLRES